MPEPTPAPPRPDLLHRLPTLLFLYALVAALTALVVVPTWGWTYWDFGDGNYQYIAARVRAGVTLYKDILAPQPPLHTLAGMAAQEFGARLLGSELYGIRLYALLCRLGAGLLLTLLARRFFGCPFRAILAGAIYLWMPIGFWWSLGYQSENLENVFLIAAMLLLIGWGSRGAVAAGICSALACHCNMTGAPFLVANATFLLFRERRLLPWYLGTALAVYTAGAVAANIWTEGAFVSNVLLNQVGTFPRTEILRQSDPTDSFWRYAFRKITAEGGKVLAIEGTLIAAAFVGACLAIRRMPKPEENRPQALRVEFLAWQLIAGLLSICFTAKGGTVNYIFVLGEAPVALFAAEAAVQTWRRFVPAAAAEWRGFGLWDTRAFLLALFPLLLAGVVIHPLAENLGHTLREEQVELPEREALALRSFIETYAQPGDTILAPPFYAYLTRTKVAGELAENYIWNIKFMNESFDGKPAEATAKMEEIADLLRRGEVKVVLLDMGQTGRVPAIAQAIEEHYRPAEPEPFRTRNTSLGLYIPKTIEPHHPPLMPE